MINHLFIIQFFYHMQSILLLKRRCKDHKSTSSTITSYHMCHRKCFNFNVVEANMRELRILSKTTMINHLKEMGLGFRVARSIYFEKCVNFNIAKLGFQRQTMSLCDPKIRLVRVAKMLSFSLLYFGKSVNYDVMAAFVLGKTFDMHNFTLKL